MKNIRLLAIFISLIFAVSGCHFVGDSDSAYGTSGFFAGLWDGAVLIWSIILTCFTDIQILDLRNSGFFYKVGFAVGALSISWNVGVFLGLISLILYILPL